MKSNIHNESDFNKTVKILVIGCFAWLAILLWGFNNVAEKPTQVVHQDQSIRILVNPLFTHFGMLQQVN